MFAIVFVFCLLLCTYQQDEVRVTKRGCTCSKSWTMGKITYVGCGNPDKDPNGEWCVVDPKSCTLARAGQLVEGGAFQGRYFDYCVEKQECTSKSYGGCDCLDSWPYKKQLISGCGNPDNDTRGPWCFVDNDTCITQATGPIRNSSGFLLGVFDYCQPGCLQEVAASLAPIDIPQITVSVSVGPPKEFEVCTTTSAGCSCLPQWAYDGNRDGISRAYYGCARTTGDSIGPWCPIVNSTSCTKGVPHTVKSGASSAQPWDYCDQSCAPPTSGSCNITVNGCNCKNVWEYDGIQQKGCTQPDADSAYSWCVVDVADCEKPSGKLPKSDQWWDRCKDPCQ
eukprot:TRINITY_DN2767_c0_g2_i1.p1 TRINITY_DN2767_c0_g2~~TRINITY_DN2767_c0_g2_i1.p1  ORF type:complete len:337 (+),score=22.36 TRINITY_DN2767_c0_g2_i1:128-1138(+)